MPSLLVGDVKAVQLFFEVRRDLVDERREVLLRRKKHVREGIRLLFYDTEHWNRLHPNEEPIDIDPDGTLQQIAYDLDIQIARDEEKA